MNAKTNNIIADDLHSLLQGWMEIDGIDDESVVPKALVDATRAALAKPHRIVCLVDGGILQGVWSDSLQNVVLIDRDSKEDEELPDLDKETEHLNYVF